MNRLTRGLQRQILLLAALVFGLLAAAQTPTTQQYPNPTTATPNPIPAAYSSGFPVNFVRTWQALRPMPDEATLISGSRTRQEVKKATQYVDGLGRPLQTVDWQASPLGKDMVAPVIYDEFGRETYKYLPYVSPTNDGKLKLDAFNEQNSFLKSAYNPANNVDGEKFFYSMTVYEASPLNRTLESYAAGNSWVGKNSSGMAVSTYYQTNAISDSVRLWKIGTGTGATPVSNSIYSAGTLYKTTTNDENAFETVEFKDKDGRLIYKKQIFGSTGLLAFRRYLHTYYVYDDLGNLRYVIQPKGAAKLRDNGWAFEAATWRNSTIAKELCFSYEYDSDNRMMVKRVPGAGEVWMVYDARDRLVMTQDSLLRRDGKWLYTDYDAQNRPVRTGLWTTTGDRAYHQGQAATSTSYPSPASGSYTILTETFYDNYDWVASSGSGLSSSLITANGITGTGYFYSASNSSFPYPQAITATAITRGMVTGTKTRNLDGGAYLFSANFYDDRGRVVQVHSKNHTGGFDTLTTQYSFSGQVLRTLACHRKGGTNAQAYRVLTKMEYDVAGRLVKMYKKTGNSPEVMITDNRYDELGQLDKKYIGKTRSSSSQNNYTTTALDMLEYDYNIRGWLRGINKAYARNETNTGWFGLELGYDYGFTNAYFNGNIAGLRWRSKGDGEQRAYGFVYDRASRLVNANFTQYTNSNWDISAGVDFSMKIGSGSSTSFVHYDENGNINGMLQKGLKLSNSVEIDSLQYGYAANSNKLNYVTDKRNDAGSTLGDFKETTNNTSQDYWYDGNGNLIKDNNKGISFIRYNHLNLPDSVVVTGKGYIEYTYDAAGIKLRKTTVDNTVSPAKTTKTDYLGGFVYRNDTLEFISHEEGRIRPARPGYSDTMYYDYFEKDHLGNVRVVLTDELQKDMYPVASLETAQLPTQRLYYDRVDSGRVGKPAGYPEDTYTTVNNWVQKLKGNAVKMGTSTLLKVMSGDKVSVRVSSWYRKNGVAPGTPASPLTDILLALTQGVPGVSAGKVAAAELGSTLLSPQVSGFLSSRDANNVTGKPKAWLNMVLLDEQMKPVITQDGKNSYFEQAGADTILTVLGTTDREITKNGYLYIYVSNETQNIDVFFDNLQVTHTRGPLISEEHFYPFGLTMAGISSKSAGKVENRKRYNGNELQDEEFSDGTGLELYDFNARTYNQQIGRFIQIDPETEEGDQESWTPYHFGLDNPVLHNDPDGRNPYVKVVKEFQGLVRAYKTWKALENAYQAYSRGFAGQMKVNVNIGKNINPARILASENAKSEAANSSVANMSPDPKSNKGGKDPNDKGKQGEEATDADKGKDKERYVGPETKKNRIADKSTETELHETKNNGPSTVQYLSSQLKDAIAWAQKTGRQFVLNLPKPAKVTKPLQEQINLGKVKRVNIPGADK